jgi:hypothetical protein
MATPVTFLRHSLSHRCHILIGITLFLSCNASAAEITIGNFSASDLSGWSTKSFVGETSYSLVQENGKVVLQARSKGNASGLIRKVSLDPTQYPILRWSWKIEHVNIKEDFRTKKGDDYVARVYVIFPRFFFWRMRAINYVWSGSMQKGTFAPSPYTGNVQLIAVESGDGKAGTWIAEQRNILEDYRMVFGEEPPEMGGIAIMTDTDNTQETSSAFYGDIFLGSR